MLVSASWAGPTMFLRREAPIFLSFLGNPYDKVNWISLGALY